MRFADITIPAKTEQDLNKQLHAMEDVLNKNYNLNINIKKTKVMVCSRNGRRGVNVRLKGKKNRGSRRIHIPGQ